MESENPPGLSLKAFGWKLWTGLFISALFVYLALRNVETERLWHVIRRADPVLVLIIIGLTLLQYLFRTYRWAIFLTPLKGTAFWSRFHAILIGFAANFALPARLGEFVRAATLGRAESVSGTATLATILIERLFDGFTLLFFLLIGLLGAPLAEDWKALSGSLRVTGYTLFAAYLVIILILAGFKYKTRACAERLDRLLFLFPGRFRSKAADTFRNFSLGLVLLKGSPSWALAVFYSFLVWATNIIQIELTSRALGLAVPVTGLFLILAMASLGTMIPSAPGFIGTFHLSVQYGFLLYGAGEEEALSAAILWHATLMIPTLFFGLIAFLSSQISLRRIRGMDDKTRDRVLPHGGERGTPPEFP